jgi:uncharacterized protein (TIGR03083 family)
MTELGEHYRHSRERLVDLLHGADDTTWKTPVPACPGWTVHDVIGHLLGNTEDFGSGRLTGIPDEALTSEQVERHRHDEPDAMLERWSDLSTPLLAALTEGGSWPPVLDVGSHEQDIRGALSHPGARDDKLILDGVRWMMRVVDVDANITLDLGDVVLQSPPKPGPDYMLRANAFEVFRFVLGRRSRDQVLALDWTPGIDDLVDRLFVFGPATAALVE